MARGRKRKSGERYPSGGFKRADKAEDELPYTPEQVRHRALALGIDPARLVAPGGVARRASLDRLCTDASAGTALGRLTWVHRADGSMTRRMGDFGGARPEPWIADEMAAAAEDYRVLWVRWHRLERMPRRHPQGSAFERRDRIHDDTIDPDDSDHARKVSDARARLRACDAALCACPRGQLVRRLVDSIVIENTMPAALDAAAVSGVANAALVALRAGLMALHRSLREGRRKAV